MMTEAIKELSIIKEHIIKFSTQIEAMYMGNALSDDELLQLRSEAVSMHDAACNAYDSLTDKALGKNG